MPAAQTGVSLVHIKYHVFLFPSPALVLFWIFCLQHLILPLALRRELGAQLDPLSLFSLWYCDSQSLGSSLLHSFIFYLPSFAFFSLLITPYPSPSNWNYNLRCTLRRSFFLLLFEILFRNGSPNFLIRCSSSQLYLLHGFPWLFSNLTPTIPLHCVLIAFYT